MLRFGACRTPLRPPIPEPFALSIRSRPTERGTLQQSVTRGHRRGEILLRGAMAGLIVGSLSACFGTRGVSVAEVIPVERGSARQEPLPDDAERSAARVMALSLSGQDRKLAQDELQKLRELQQDNPSAIFDNALDLYQAGLGRESYRRYVEEALRSNEIDATLRLKFERYLEDDPLARAERRMSENRMLRFGQVFNQLASPAANAATGNPVSTIASSRSAILALLVLSTAPEMTTQQRQALRAYQTFLQESPDAPEAKNIQATVTRLETRLRNSRIESAHELAEKALAASRPDAALLHLARARRIDPDSRVTQRLSREALEREEIREENLKRSLRADPALDPDFRATAGAPGDSLAAEVLIAPLDELPELAVKWAEEAPELGLTDELDFLAAAGRLASGDEDGYFEAMREHASRSPAETNMARHAFPIATTQNRYARYQQAKSQVRRQLTGFFFLGSTGQRVSQLDEVPLVLRPLAWVIEIPTFVVSVATTPLRIIELPSAGARLSGPVIDTGEAYLQQFPEGAHAQEVHRELESRYAARSQWTQALEHHRASGRKTPKRIAEYRERIAQRMLEAARLPRRADIRVSLYSNLIEEYGDTRAAKSATADLEKLRKELTPQSIRISRDFLLENPELTQPGALALRPELLDGDEDNGELADEGVLLIGRTVVRIRLEGRDPVESDLGAQAFARFSSLLEAAYERGLQRDSRARPISDPQRDQFFERARLGLLDEADFRLAAASSFEFLGMNERYGPGKYQESILPVELVVRGGIEDLGIAAIPRIRMPKESEDAFLYK